MTSGKMCWMAPMFFLAISFGNIPLNKLLVVKLTCNADKHTTDSINETKAKSVCQRSAIVGLIKRLMKLTVIYRIIVHEYYRAWD